MLDGASHEGPQGDEATLWECWRQQGDVAAREALIAMHLPYARIVAATYYARRYHNEVEFDDYLQLATLGLIESMDRFDPHVGVQFRTFASRRIQGAILDGLERATEMHQQIAARQRLEAQRRHVFAEGSSDELGERRTPEQILQYVAEAGLAFALGWLLDGTGMVDRREQTEHLPFYRSVALRELREQLVTAVRNLPAQERTVIYSHYLQGVSFEEIAATLELTRGRISQIHRAGLANLRKMLSSSGECNVLL